MIEKLFIADPYNEEHIKLFKDFEEKNNINNNIMETLKSNTSENIIKECLFLEEKNEIKDYSFIYAEKDRKAATLEFANIDTKQRNRKLISMATDYSFNSLGMKIVIIAVNPDNRNLINNLIDKEYENLGEENGKIIFMKEQELEKKQGMIRHGNT